MRRSVAPFLMLAVLVVACGDSRQEPAEKPAAKPTAVVEEPEPEADARSQVGLTDAERKRLKREYAAEALARINAENAEAVGTRLLAEIEQELAAERAAADAGVE
jgi:hypothetical protein